MKPRDDLSAEFVRSILDYDPETGLLTWKERDDCRNQFNARFSGKQAGSLDKKTGYWRIGIRNKLYQVHRVAWLIVFGEWPSTRDIDHIDMNRSNNAILNLRLSTRSRNKGNQEMYRQNTAGFKGVHFNKQRGRFSAGIGVDMKRIHLGYFDSAIDAAIAYNAAAVKHFGEFARLNVVITKEQ